MQYVAIATSVLSAYNTIEQGKSQKAMYNLQAKQVGLKAQRDALQYEQQANQVLERMLMNNATASARGFSGGVQGFTGSAGLIQTRNEKVAGRDVEILQTNSKEAISFGEIQSKMLKDAGSQALRGSYFDAIAKLGQAAYMSNQTYTGGVSSTQAGSTVPVVEKSFNSTPSYMRESYVA
jgi:hypothetical protein